MIFEGISASRFSLSSLSLRLSLAFDRQLFSVTLVTPVTEVTVVFATLSSTDSFLRSTLGCGCDGFFKASAFSFVCCENKTTYSERRY